MKRGLNILIGVCVIILLIMIIGLVSDFTGKVVEEQKKQVRFYFYDDVSRCELNGYVFVNEKVIGKSSDGFFNLSYANYLENFGNDDEISIFGKLGDCFNNPELFFDEYWEVPEIKKYHFPGENIFNFKAKINSNNPSKKELQGFIQPEKVKEELGNVNALGNKLNDLSEINFYLNNKINYVDDWDFNKEINYWQTPVETLNINQGDCEDYSTTLLSLFLAYDNSLNCYNIVFTSHVTTFCYIDDYYIYYDQSKTELKRKINKNSINAKFELKDLKKDYLEYLEVDEDIEKKAHYAFNDKEFVEFNEEEDFIDWQYSLENEKNDFDLFLSLDEQIIINTQNLSEEWEGELGTQTISLSNSKVYSYLLISLFIIIIILVVVLIRFNKT
jgi:hypothetical protein